MFVTSHHMFFTSFQVFATSCQMLVTFMSHVCHFISRVCLTHITCLSHSYHVFVSLMSRVCLTHVTCLSHSCHVFVSLVSHAPSQYCCCSHGLQGPTSREATTDLMARRGQGVEPLPDGPWRHQPRLRPPDEQVVGTFPRIPITTFTPLQSPPLASSNSHVSSTSKFSQSTQSDAFMSTVERSNQQSLVYQDMREGSIPLAGDQAQSDGRVTPSVCPLCGVTIMGDIFNAVSHMAECRITAAN